MITKQFAEEYITDFSGKIGGAVVAALLSLAALAGAIFWIIRQPPKLDVAGDDFAKVLVVCFQMSVSQKKQFGC